MIKSLKVNNMYVMKRNSYPEERFCDGEIKTYDQYFMTQMTMGIIRLGGLRFIVKDISTYLRDVSYLIYFPDLHITIDMSWEYLKNYVTNNINFNKIWNDLNSPN
jgi:hypothetical protein